MKKIGKIISISAAVLALAACVIFATACGFQPGNYSGEYTYKSGEGTVGYSATFTVDEDGLIWDVVFTAINDADAGVNAPGIGQRPWDGTKITRQFDGSWSISDLEDAVVEVDENGAPTGKIETDKDFTANLGYEVGAAAGVLAMQAALEAGPAAE